MMAWLRCDFALKSTAINNQLTTLRRHCNNMFSLPPRTLVLPAVPSLSPSRPAKLSEPLLPAGSFDTHVHVFEPEYYPLATQRAYSPGTAPLQDLLEFTAQHTSNRQPSQIVLVQPSPYGYDNSLLLDTLRALQRNGRVARGIAVVNPVTTTQEELFDMHKLGVRGLRIVSIRDVFC